MTESLAAPTWMDIASLQSAIALMQLKIEALEKEVYRLKAWSGEE